MTGRTFAVAAATVLVLGLAASASAGPRGKWTRFPGTVKAAQSTSAYAGATTAAGLGRDGTPSSAWYSTGEMGFHYGTDPNDPDTRTWPLRPKVASGSSGSSRARS